MATTPVALVTGDSDRRDSFPLVHLLTTVNPTGGGGVMCNCVANTRIE